jgi:hypothetical protein
MLSRIREAYKRASPRRAVFETLANNFRFQPKYARLIAQSPSVYKPGGLLRPLSEVRVGAVWEHVGAFYVDHGPMSIQERQQYSRDRNKVADAALSEGGGLHELVFAEGLPASMSLSLEEVVLCSAVGEALALPLLPARYRTEIWARRIRHLVGTLFL